MLPNTKLTRYWFNTISGFCFIDIQYNKRGNDKDTLRSAPLPTFGGSAVLRSALGRSAPPPTFGGLGVLRSVEAPPLPAHLRRACNGSASHPAPLRSPPSAGQRCSAHCLMKAYCFIIRYAWREYSPPAQRTINLFFPINSLHNTRLNCQGVNPLCGAFAPLTVLRVCVLCN